MSVRIMSDVFESDSLGPTERLIMLALADHADDEGKCYPSIARLCRRTGLKERAVQNNIRSLAEQGYLTIIIGGGRNNCNLYIVRAKPRIKCPPHNMPPASDDAETPHLVTENPASDAPKPSRTTKEAPEEPLVVPQPKKPKRRASSISEDWEPSERNVEDAFKKQFTPQEIRDEAQRFRDYHLAKGTTFADWDAGWRTWIGNARKFGASRSTGRQQSPAGQQLSGLAGAAMRRRNARQQGYEG